MGGGLREKLPWLPKLPQRLRDLPEQIPMQVRNLPTWEQVRQKQNQLPWNYETKRVVFYAVNIVFLAVAVGSIAVGIYLYTARDEYAALTPMSFSAMSSAGLLVFTGVTASIIVIVGFTAAWLRNRTLLITYLLFILLLGLVQAGTGIMGFVERERSALAVRHDLLMNINRSQIVTSQTNRQLTFTWDKLQSSLKCCGADGYMDWFNNVQWPKNQFVPDSCCDPQKFKSEDDMFNCGKMTTKKELWFSTGCYLVFSDWLFEHIRIVGSVSAILLLVEVGVLLITYIVYRELKNGGPCKDEHEVTAEDQIQKELNFSGPEAVVQNRLKRMVEVRRRFAEMERKAEEEAEKRAGSEVNAGVDSDDELVNVNGIRRATRTPHSTPDPQPLLDAEEPAPEEPHP